MKKYLLLAFLSGVVWGTSLSIPPFSQPVTDQAQILQPDTIRNLNQDLSQLYASGGAQIAVLTIPSLEGQTIEEQAVEIFEKWQIGKKGKDNGVLLLIAKKERKIRIEVGYGLESQIPDTYAKRIIEDVMLPLFRNGEFTLGVVLGVRQIAGLAKGDLNIVKTSRRKLDGLDFFLRLLHLLICLVSIFFLYFLKRAQKLKKFGARGYRGHYSRGWGSGGGWSGSGGLGGGGWGGGGGRSGGGGASGGW